MKESKRFPNLWAEFKAQSRTLGRDGKTDRREPGRAEQQDEW